MDTWRGFAVIFDPLKNTIGKLLRVGVLSSTRNFLHAVSTWLYLRNKKVLYFCSTVTQYALSKFTVGTLQASVDVPTVNTSPLGVVYCGRPEADPFFTAEIYCGHGFRPAEKVIDFRARAHSKLATCAFLPVVKKYTLVGA